MLLDTSRVLGADAIKAVVRNVSLANLDQTLADVVELIDSAGA